MAIVPVFCPEEPEGSISKEKALELIELTHQRALAGDGKDPLEKGISKDEAQTRRQAFDFYNGMEQGLSWASRLLKKTFIDPSPAASRRVLLKTAEVLEDRAASLRETASYMEEPPKKVPKG